MHGYPDDILVMIWQWKDVNAKMASTICGSAKRLTHCVAKPSEVVGTTADVVTRGFRPRMLVWKAAIPEQNVTISIGVASTNNGTFDRVQ